MWGVNMTVGVECPRVHHRYFTGFWGVKWTELQDYNWKKKNSFCCNEHYKNGINRFTISKKVDLVLSYSLNKDISFYMHSVKILKNSHGNTSALLQM